MALAGEGRLELELTGSGVEAGGPGPPNTSSLIGRAVHEWFWSAVRPENHLGTC